MTACKKDSAHRSTTGFLYQRSESCPGNFRRHLFGVGYKTKNANYELDDYAINIDKHNDHVLPQDMQGSEER